ncbi:MAG: hypothetical protein JOZ52_13335 [Acidobacteria bacterium]|nr:hypothetical protein [Acidobacteriota bacterium]
MMRFRGVGRALMAAGVGCLIFYILIALYSVTPALIKFGNLLFYVGIVALIVGVVVRLMRQSPTA